jgi:RimJ/RimL family protein N-acetyltransferase
MNQKTARTLIRQFSQDDFTDLRKMLIDIEVMKSTGIRTVQNYEAIHEKLKSWIADDQIWCVESLETNKCIGWVMLKFKEETDPEVGYMFNRSSWGLGFVIEVSQFIIDYGFEILKYKRIVAKCDFDNNASINVLKKNGMQQINNITGDCELAYFEVYPK